MGALIRQPVNAALMLRYPRYRQLEFELDLKEAIHRFAERWDNEQALEDWRRTARLLRAAGILASARWQRLRGGEAPLLPYRRFVPWHERGRDGCHARCGCRKA